MTYLFALPLLFAQAAPAAPDVDTVPPPAAEQQVAPAEPAGDAAGTAATSTENNLADAEPAEASEDEADAGIGFWDKLEEISNSGALGLMRRGGIFMVPILMLGIIALGVIIERYRSLKMLQTDSTALRAEVRDLLQQDRVEEALARCETEQGPVAAVLGTGLRKYLVLKRLGYDTARIEEQVVKAMDDYGIHIVAALEKHMPVLATVANAAPTLGFLGTVAGMVVSFDNIVAERQAGQGDVLTAAAGGISVALLTTAFGLIVGMPAFIAFNYYNGVINRFTLEVEESATELIESVTLQETLAQRNGSVPKKHPAPEHPEEVPAEV
jgi:biopolymer transport protein ExbB